VRQTLAPLTFSKGHRGRTAHVKVTFEVDGVVYSNLTRWLPVTLYEIGNPIHLDDDFTLIVRDLERSKKRYLIRENGCGQRAVFVEE
jgi:hypothetical protein